MIRLEVMKRKDLLYPFFILALLLAACTREVPQPIATFKIDVELPSNFKPEVKYANKQITITSSSNSYTVTTDAQGVANVSGLIPDVYNITTKWEISGAEYRQLISDNEPVEDKAKVLVTAVLNNQQIFSSADLNLALDKMILRSLLISKVYYTGTKDDRNKNYLVDAYIEIFNTSDEVVYIDGKYLALAESASTPAYPASENPDYVYARQICQFPGSGTDYPIAPGASMVISAKGARNHLLNAATSVDLSTADFEVKELDGLGNPDVKALPIVSNSIPALKFLNLLSGGPNGVFLFETNEDILQWDEVYAPGKDKGERFRKVPIETVIDGVECLKNSASTGPDVNQKRLQYTIDAGYTFVNATSGYTHESVERKVASITNGRIKLVDTNNSLEDFVVVTDPTPRKYDKPELNN